MIVLGTMPNALPVPERPGQVLFLLGIIALFAAAVLAVVTAASREGRKTAPLFAQAATFMTALATAGIFGGLAMSKIREPVVRRDHETRIEDLVRENWDVEVLDVSSDLANFATVIVQDGIRVRTCEFHNQVGKKKRYALLTCTGIEPPRPTTTLPSQGPDGTDQPADLDLFGLDPTSSVPAPDR